jgi:hypothetical protein
MNRIVLQNIFIKVKKYIIFNKYLFIKTSQSCVLKTVSQSKMSSNTNMEGLLVVQLHIFIIKLVTRIQEYYVPYMITRMWS